MVRQSGEMSPIAVWNSCELPSTAPPPPTCPDGTAVDFHRPPLHFTSPAYSCVCVLSRFWRNFDECVRLCGMKTTEEKSLNGSVCRLHLIHRRLCVEVQSEELPAAHLWGQRRRTWRRDDFSLWFTLRMREGGFCTWKHFPSALMTPNFMAYKLNKEAFESRFIYRTFLQDNISFFSSQSAV